MYPGQFSLGIVGTFLNLQRQKHKKNKKARGRHKRQHQTNRFTIQGKVQQSLPLSNRVPHFNTNQTGLFWRKEAPTGAKVSCGSDLPYCMESASSQMSIPCSNCQALRQPVPLRGTLKDTSSGHVVLAAARILYSKPQSLPHSHEQQGY